MSKPTEDPGVMREVCFPTSTIATANDLDQSPKGEQASKKRLMDVSLSKRRCSRWPCLADALLRIGMIHLLLACSLLG